MSLVPEVSRRLTMRSLLLLAGLVLSGCSGTEQRPYPERVEIRRTSFGVPHITADDLGAMAYGLAWAHMEDYAELVVERLTMVKGELALHNGEGSLDSDFWWRRRYEQAVEAYPTLHRDTRDLYEGYSAAVNRYIELHPEEVTGPAGGGGFASRGKGAGVCGSRSARAR